MTYRIAVLGCGTMGLKIAGNFVSAGHHVKIFDENENQLRNVNERIRQDAEQLYRDGLIEQLDFTGEISTETNLENAVKNVQFVFECVPENFELKENLFQKIGQLVQPNTIICSNSIQLDLEKLFQNLPNRKNCLGVRFLYPVYYIREVELTSTKWTNPETVASVRKLLEAMDKILLFRSSSTPFMLNESEREVRRKIRREMLIEKNSLASHQTSSIPLSTSKQTEKNSSETIRSKDEQTVPQKCDSNLICAICMDRTRDTILVSCNHLIACNQCATSLLHRRQPCPVCRKPIKNITRIYI